MPAHRSLLFVPGSRPDRFEKALAAGADAICIDLEDAVAPADKASARAATFAFVGSCDAGRRAGVYVRINSLHTADGLADVLAFQGLKAAERPATLMLPKVESADELVLLANVLGEACPSLIPLIETPRGLENAAGIASTPQVDAILFGGADLSASLGRPLSWEAMLGPRDSVSRACAAAGILLYDVPWLDVADEAGLAASTRQAMALGFTGRACIHPAQVATVNACFTPDSAAIKQAHRVLAAFEAAQGGVALLDGKLIELPVVRAARRTLDAARAAGL